MWLRLRSALKDLLMEGDNQCLRWYHRQLLEAAELRYGSDAQEKKIIHDILGRYFADIVDASLAVERSIRRQPITTRGESKRKARRKGAGTDICLGGAVWSAPPALVNQRRAVEAAAQLMEAGLLLEAAAELGDLDALCGRFKAGVGMQTAELLSKLLDLLATSGLGTAPVPSDVVRSLEHVRRWLLLDATTIQNRPNCMLGSLRNQPHVLALKEEAQAIHVENGDTTCFVAGRAYGGKESFDSLLSILTGHSADVMGVAWSPDGKRLASGADDKRVHVWDGSSGTLIMRLEGHTKQVTSVCWSPDCSLVVSGSLDGTLRVWDMAVGTVRFVAEANGEIKAVAWSRTNRVASGTANGILCVWDPITWAADCVLGDLGVVSDVRWSPDGLSLAVCSIDLPTIRVFDAASWQAVSVLKGHSAGVAACSWSPDGERLASGSFDSTLRIWDVLTGAGAEVLGVSAGGVGCGCTSVDWSNDGRWVVCGWFDATVRVWSVESTSLDILRGHTNGVFSVYWSPDSRFIVSGSDDETVRVWAPLMSTSSSNLLGHSDRTDALSWSGDGSVLVSASWDGHLGLWDSVTGRMLKACSGHTGRVRCVSVSACGDRIASGAEDCTVRVWDIEGVCRSVLSGHTKSVLTVHWGGNEGQYILSGAADSTVRCWSVSTGESVWTLSEQDGRGEVNSVSWSSDSTLVAVGRRHPVVQVWDISAIDQGAAAECTLLEGHTAACVYAVVWRPAAGRLLASGGEDECVILWDVETKKKVATVVGFSGWVKCLDWTPCGTKLATGSYDGKVRVWCVAVDGQGPCNVSLFAALEIHSWFVRSVKWNHDGTRLASGSDNTTLVVWDFVAADDLV